MVVSARVVCESKDPLFVPCGARFFVHLPLSPPLARDTSAHLIRIRAGTLESRRPLAAKTPGA